MNDGNEKVLYVPWAQDDHFESMVRWKNMWWIDVEDYIFVGVWPIPLINEVFQVSLILVVNGG